MKSLKAMLREGGVLVGITMQHVTGAWLARLYQHSGADFVYIEYEHGFFNEADLADFVLACRMGGLPVVAKVPECSRTHVAKLLECGVVGIQLPWTESAEQVERLVSYVKFPPIGIRAVAPGMGNCDYNLQTTGRELIEMGNRETVVLAHVETKRGIENLDAILANPHVDVLFLGMYDLSNSYGQPGDFRHPDVVAAVETALAAARRHGKTAGMYVPDARAAAPWVARGFRFFETASEVDLIDAGARNLIKQFREIRLSPSEPRPHSPSEPRPHSPSEPRP
ncbi:MAG TPA: aldolase/citrate lyase family protein [Gemmataceae bacterium]|jgi:2-keto-3-deoxy-L-rhamnonate aldolase RhmA|nr:aldolase/citrate lyase family protein [Gemmataceae bacterium]